MKRSIEKLRVEYGNALLSEEGIDNPLLLFEKWLQEAIRAEVFEPNGMTLSTVSSLGHPSARTVLLKGIGEKGLLFFSDRRSRKAEQMHISPHVSLTFWWRELFRQVCIEGRVERASRRESRDYFERRPKGAQVAACISHQSAPIASRYELEEAFVRFQTRYKKKRIPCPLSWQGYWVWPFRIEFWQGRAHRLHDRLLYVRMDREWIVSRLAP